MEVKVTNRATALEPGEATQIIAAELPRISKLLEDLLQASVRIEGYLRIVAVPVISPTLSRYFKTGKQLRAYELTDGSTSTRQIGKAIGVDQKTVSTWWRTWEKEHKIVHKVGKRGQFKRLYSLAELVIANFDSGETEGTD
jgi:hypothetical protein